MGSVICCGQIGHFNRECHLMTAFVIMVEKESYCQGMQIADKSKTNFKKYLNSNMNFYSRTHNYVGDNAV